MRSNLGVAALVCVAAAVLLSPTASGSSGALVITSNTLLTEDHEGSIVVARNGVTLDCAGHTLNGAGPGSGPGVELSGRRNVTIKSCRVTNFDSGLLVVATSGSRFMNNVAESNRLSGFELYVSSGNVLAGNRADGNLVHGVSAVGGGNNTVRENSAPAATLTWGSTSSCRPTTSLGRTSARTTWRTVSTFPRRRATS